ncbi:MAG TPA: hypothetical protein VE863_02540 [Pyrinomonadaceae bacterium]|jgi:hypothetical protein|nr:hypothetical protein [Pyrinomonadaceae bacterium]
MHIKTRLLAVILIVVFAALTYLGWHELTTTGSYHLKLAAFAPVGIVGGFFMLAFPAKAGKPQTTGDKLLVLVVFAMGIVAGLVNWYLMDPGFFHR